MNVTPETLLIVCPLVFLASLVDAIGGGGGLISLPAYLTAGLPAALASGTNKFTAACGTAMAAWKYARGGRLMLRPALCAVAGAVPFAYVGVELLKRTPDAVMRAVLLCVIPAMAVVLLFKRDSAHETKPMTPARYFACFAVGALCGLYDGFCGPGTGTLLIMGLTWIAGLDMVTASGSAKLINLASNVSALVSHIAGGNVVYLLGLPAVVCSVAGAWCGAKLALTRGAKLIRGVMFGVLALLVVKLAREYFPV